VVILHAGCESKLQWLECPWSGAQFAKDLTKAELKKEAKMGERAESRLSFNLRFCYRINGSSSDHLFIGVHLFQRIHIGFSH